MVGSRLVERLRARGNDVHVLARSHGVDVTSGAVSTMRSGALLS